MSTSKLGHGEALFSIKLVRNIISSKAGRDRKRANLFNGYENDSLLQHVGNTHDKHLC